MAMRLHDVRIDSRRVSRRRCRLADVKQLPPEMAGRLRDAAPELLSGDIDLSVARVASVTGIPRATLYYYLSGKADLAAFFGQTLVGIAAENSARAAAGPGTVTERLRRALLAIYELPPDMPLASSALLSVIASSEDFLPALAQLRDVGFRAVRDLLIEGVATGELEIDDIDLALTAICGALEVVTILDVRDGRPIDLSLISGVTDLLLRGLAAGGPTLSARATDR